ncbi:MAG: hypothetical protein PVG06_09265 [Desulfobacterales bacterium]|jgi:hypothetical protein
MKKVENLKKVTLRLQAGTADDNMNLSLSVPEFEFIFGIGPNGMCPFEYQLVNKAAGEEISMPLKKEQTHQLFGHLDLPFRRLFEEHDLLYLNVQILKIEQPDSREVVKALADIASHDHGCDCGCGC